VPHRIIIAPAGRAALRQGQEVREQQRLADAIVGGWSIASITTWQAGFPLNVQQSNPNSILGGSTGARPNLVRASTSRPRATTTTASRSADHPTATWINPAAFSTVAFGQFGNTPRTITDLRTPTQFNTDLSFMKNFRLGGSKSAHVKLEVLNLFNRPTVAPSQAQHVRAWQRVRDARTAQSGFMRIMQFMFRFSF
jgi:hypothetical protein